MRKEIAAMQECRNAGMQKAYAVPVPAFLHWCIFALVHVLAN
jgi:hypothetical protein